MPEILQKSIPYDVSKGKGLPGISPLSPGGWIIHDEVFAEQMAERDRLLRHMPARVHCDAGASVAAKQEVLSEVLRIVTNRAGYQISDAHVTRPDGVRVDLAGDDPLVTAARLIQEDLLLHETRDGTDGEHVLTAGVLCFPASWTLSEKVGHPLTRIHAPVEVYDPNVAKRVQRLFDGIKSGRPLWRFNVLQYPIADLFQPRSERAPRRADADYETGEFTRSEHQALVRLPVSGAVLFALHTYVVQTG